MSALEDLLDVQDHDLRIDQLRHRKATLPEKAELTELHQRRAAIEATRNDVAGRRDEVAARQEHAEQEIAAAEKRIGEIDSRMRSGAVTASRDLQAMQGEVDSIRQRVSAFEDEALAAMDEREPLDAEIEGYDAQLAALDDSAAALHEKIAAAEAEIDGEIEAEQHARAGAAEKVPAELAATYEKLRARLGGIGAARLDGNRCSGCHLTLPATELDRIRHQPPDTLFHCEQCGRILVRTS
ncbi:MAG TPA: C4-type zinc ribbon domain-containing protein [Acidimicrobiales bacterium]|nr:C4-type zinc ribbon domain-containing protein [Acidimicrobiales bacterium]